MSTPYNLEPRAHGLIAFKTTFGDLELELFTKECPKNTKNFVQLCLDGFYDGTVFERVEKDFIAIGGAHDNLDSDVLELNTAPDEFHQRLRFSRRGLLATANTEKNVNGPKFFFALGPAPELQNKHTIFGRLVGDSVYYLVDLNECQVDDELRPISDKKILQVIVLENPYPDLKPRRDLKEKLTRLTSETDAAKSDDEYLKPKLDIKNSKKLSYYDDSDEDETSDTEIINPVASKPELDAKIESSSIDNEKREDTFREPQPQELQLDQIDGQPSADGDAREKKLREIREQIKKLKQKLENESATKIRTLSDRRRESLNAGSSLNSTKDSKADSSRHSNVEDPDPELQKELRLASKKGRQRERETLELMHQFKKKLKETHCNSSDKKTNANVEVSESNHVVEEDEDAELELELADGDDWLHHKFDANGSSNGPAKDANMRGDDWYSIDDPRNPMVGRVESERANEYRRYKHRDRHSHEHDSDRERRHRSDHKSSRHRNHHHR